MTAQLTERHPVDRLAEEFVARYRSGERPTIAEYTARYPELADKLREILAALILMEEHAPARTTPDDSSANGRQKPLPVPQQLGEYSIVRELGRGGMGVVYEAVQESLGRHVALKVLPSYSLIDPLRLKRFQHEAQAAAKLHHTNIVPVFGVGMEAGVHFYAMQFIQGRSLEDVLDELRRLKDAPHCTAEVSSVDLAKIGTSGSAAGLKAADNTPSAVSLSTLSDSPRYYHSVARLGAQVADALDYAHRQGVVHRDIKPSNLLLDAEGTIWITDFGLARCAGQEELTQTGDLVGTLRYAAPERLRGDGDARSDLYSLALSLYELLTLRHAFEAADRVSLVRQIAEDEPPRPRRIDARIPRDLETIVLKAMSANPAGRYASAAAMAADLRRFLDDRPIAARRVGPGERLWRWCARRPALAGLAAALLLSLTIGLFGVLWQWSRAETNFKEATRQQGIAEEMLGVARQEQRRAEQSLEEVGRQRAIAEREAKESESNYQAARHAVNELFTVVSEDTLISQPGLQPLRLQLLTRALEFYEERLADRVPDDAARRDLALAYLRLGIFKKEFSPTGEQASDAYRRAIALLEPSEAAGDRITTILLARAENSLALEQIRLRNSPLALETLIRARSRLEQLLAKTPSDAAAEATLAMTFNNLGWQLAESRRIPGDERFEGAIEFHEQALAIYRRLADRKPDDDNLKLSISNTLSNMGRRHSSLGLHREARSMMEECLQIRQELASTRPKSLQLQTYVAASFNGLGDVIRSSDLPAAERLQQASARYYQAAEIQERMVRENPAVLHYRQELAGTTANLSALLRRHGEVEQAIVWIRRDIAEREACLELAPHDTAMQAQQAGQFHSLSEMEYEQGRFEESLSAARKSREMWRVVRRYAVDLREHDKAIRDNLRHLMIELGMQDQAAELCALAEERRELAGDSTNDKLALAWEFERAFRAVSRTAELSGEARATIDHYLQVAVAAFRQAAEAEPGLTAKYAASRRHLVAYAPLVGLDADLEHNPFDAAALDRRWRLLHQLGDNPGQEADWDRARERIDARLEESPRDAAALVERATLHYGAGNWQEAIADCNRALAARPGDRPALYRRAQAYAELGQWQAACDDFTALLAVRPELNSHWPQWCRAAYEAGHIAEAEAAAARLVERAQDNAVLAHQMAWAFLLQGDAGRFPDACVTLAERAVREEPLDSRRTTLGGIYFALARYRDAAAVLKPAAAGGSASAPLAGFWLAISLQHLGEEREAQAAFRRAIRKWKASAVQAPDREKQLNVLWREARRLLDDGETATSVE